jgi:hypothetical protein
MATTSNPHAKMLLGLVALRERQDEVAREEFTDLGGEFPENPIFASELERLNHQTLAIKNAGRPRKTPGTPQS